MRIGLSLKLSEPKYNVLAQNIRALFADGSQGWWYDDNDTTTLFQDSAGTTPVTAVEQFVGLQLDKSKGLVLGPELVTNGDNEQALFNFGLLINQDTLARAAAPGGGFAASFTSTTNTAVSHRSYDNSLALQAGKAYIFTGRVYVPTGGVSLFKLYDNGDGSWAGFSIATKDQWVSFTAIRPPKASNWSLGIGNNLSDTVASGQISFWLDNLSIRELPGNHRYAPASGNRPIWSKRVNLVTYSQDFTNAAWVKTNASVSSTPVTAPDGTATANRVSFTTGTKRLVNNAPTTLPVNTGITQRLWAKGTVGGEQLRIFDGWTNTTPVTLTTSWVLYTLTMNASGTSNSYFIDCLTDNATVEIWAADIRASNQATGTMPLYQRVNTSSDYDTNGFPGYLKADGVDDFLQTNSIDFNTVTSDGLSRRNLFVNPTQFDASGWVLSSITVTANATTAPDGTATADKIVEVAASAGHSLYQNVAVTNGTTYTMSCYLKKSERDFGWLKFSDSATNWGRTFNLATGQVGSVVSGFTAPTTSTITDAGNGWWRCTITMTAGATGTGGQDIGVMATDGTRVYLGDGTSGIFLWGAQLETGSTATAFQNIGADKITLCAGVRKLSDAAQAVVTELSASIASNNGTFLLAAPDGATNTYGWDSKGTTQVDAVASTFTAPLTNVVTGIGNISGDSAIIRVNGVVADTETGDQGTGNYGNYVTYFFRRGGSSLPFNGYEYGNVAVGKLLTADQLTALETYMNGLTKAY